MQDVLQYALHPLWVGNEVRRKIAAVELQPFDDIDFAFEPRAFFDRDDAVLADFFHGFGNDATDLLIGVGADSTHLGDHLALDVVGMLLDLLHGHFDGPIDTALQCHGIGAGSHGLHAFAENCLGQQGCGGGAVPRHI